MQGDPQPPPGVVELREDVPLKAGGAGGVGGARWCAGGPRLIVACFGALSVAITLALFTQIYYGDYEVVPHGSVSSSAAACSGAGAAALRAGGRALDAAAAAALCLAVAAPHRTSLDASGSLLLWEYRQFRTQKPMLAEWGGVPVPAADAQAAAGAGASGGGGGGRPPRLVAALAHLHAEYGVLPWARLLQPAIDLARNGFPVSESLAQALAAEAPDNGTLSPAPDSVRTAPELATYLESLQLNTSAELSAAWGGGVVRAAPPLQAAWGAGAARVFAGGGAGAAAALRALALALDPPPLDLDDASRRVVAALVQESASGGAGGGTGGTGGAGGVASGLAVIDPRDTYVALVSGLSTPFGSGPAVTAGAGEEAGTGWRRDEPAHALDLAPAIMVDGHVCGTRSVVGAESGAALAQVCAALAAGAPAAAAVERPRLAVGAGGVVPESDAPAPAAAANLVQQVGDALLSHADSRAGGLASRF